MSFVSFDKDYYECGVEKKISGYSNFRYLPTRSFEEASTLKNLWGSGSLLDYGCAKGFLVHSLRQLGFDAYGFDISEYAIKNCHPRVVEYVFNKSKKNVKYSLVLCKDVMEHVPEGSVPAVLEDIKGLLEDEIGEALFVIPLGDDDKFRIREYEMDVTHVTKKGEDWWIDQLRSAGFRINDFKYSLGNIKKKWTSQYEYGNGFFLVGV